MTFTIYRLKDTDENARISFMGSDQLRKYQHWPPKPEDYEPIWTEDHPDKDDIDQEVIFAKFNVAHPADFHHHSMSVGDIVVKDGKHPGAYFCDSIGWTKLSDFYAAVTATT